ncbi:MAG: helix-turn-helix domain-containing protein [Tannerella sp.]|jgi:AraC-like DNA-binding protein|nr:helix-turn-helix domain-containing protein [Tannerella sp.]
MRSQSKIIIVIAFFAIFVATSLFAQQSNRQKKDSLWRLIPDAEGKEKLKHYKNLSLLYFPEVVDDSKMDTLITILEEGNEEAKRQGNISLQGGFTGTLLAALRNKGMYDEVIRRAPGYMDNMEKVNTPEVWYFYYSMYDLLFNAHLYKGDYPTALSVAERMYADAQARDNKFGMGTALRSLAGVYDKQFRKEEEEKYIRQCIELLKDDDEWLSMLTGVYFRLCECLRLQDRTDEALQAAGEYEKTIRRYEEHTKSPQPTSWNNLYKAYLGIYLERGDFDNAEIYCDKVESMDKGADVRLMVFNARARIFNGRGQYDKALEMADSAMDFTRTAIEENAVRGIKMMILANTDRSEELYRLAEKAQAVNDSIRDLEFNRQLDELRTVYEVDKLTAEKERHRNYFLFAAGGCLLLIIVLGIWIRYSRVVTLKNRSLVRQIREQDFMDAELERERAKSRRLQSLLSPDAYSPSENDRRDEMFLRLTQIMQEKQIYTDLEISRKTIADMLGTNEHYLHECIRENTDMSFFEYITSLRLLHARKLLVEKKENLTIDAIAFESGFNSRSAFYRVFRKKYELSPDEFRKLARKNDLTIN